MRKLLLLFFALLTSVSGAWAAGSVILCSQVTDLANLSSTKYYILQNNGSSGYIKESNSQLVMSTSYDYSSVVQINYDGENLTIKNVSTGKYFQLFTDQERVSLGASSANFTFNTTDCASGLYRIANGSIYMNRDDNDTYPKGHTGTGNYSKWKIYEVFVCSTDMVYTIKAHFKDYTDLYFYNNDGTLAFNSSASNGVKDYWIPQSSGNATYPWKFKSGRGDGKFLSPQYGLSTTGGWIDVKYCSNENSLHLYGSYNDASTSNIRYLATWSPEGKSKKSGFAQSGSGGCFGSVHYNDEWSTDYIIEEVTGVDVYTVVSNIAAGGVTYTPDYTGVKEQTSGGFYIFSSEPSSSNFTAISVANYTPGVVSVDASAKTIAVNYTANITYTLTDVNGETYSWSASGTYGTAPTITGCDGATISNEVWNEGSRTYTADITFPFPISSNSVTNWTYIGSFATNSYTASRLCWYVKSSDATKFYGGQDDLPTNQSGELEKWEWSIIPACSNGAFSFTIKNASTNKYVTMAATPSAGFSDQISLTNTGTAFTFNNHRWKLPTATELYISQNSSTANEQEVGVYGPNGAYGIHAGNDIAFITPANFTTLLANLKTAYRSFNNYFLSFTSGNYTETEDGKTIDTYNTYNSTTRNVVKDTPSEYLTAAQFQTYTDAYKAAIAGLNANISTGTFLRIRSQESSLVSTPTYMIPSNIIVGSYYQCALTQDASKISGAETILYYDSSNHLYGYSNGSWVFNNAGYLEWKYAFNHTATTITFEKVGIKFNNAKYVGALNDANGIYLDSYASMDGDKFNFIIEPVSSLPVTITAAGYATLNSPVALTIPDGVTAYTGKVNSGYMRLTALDGTIPANTPVILKGAAGTYKFDLTTSEGFEGDNDLSGTIAEEDVSKVDILTLQVIDDEIGLYTYTGESLGGFKAYLSGDKASQIKSLVFAFDEADAITEVAEKTEVAEGYFDLSGRRIAKPTKGLYIVNGKKVVIK